MLEVCHACVAAQKVLGWPRAGATTAALCDSFDGLRRLATLLWMIG
jgi:hypothetical protein